jgi:hypothetical protein
MIIAIVDGAVALIVRRPQCEWVAHRLNQHSSSVVLKLESLSVSQETQKYNNNEFSDNLKPAFKNALN